LLQKQLFVGIVILFFVSTTIPQTIFSTNKIGEHDVTDDSSDDLLTYYRLNQPQYKKFSSLNKRINQHTEEQNLRETYNQSLRVKSSQQVYSLPKSGPMNSPWPMHGYDDRRNGRSPYATINTTNLEKWRFYVDHPGDGGAIIDDNGIIYFCDTWGTLYAIYPNGTKKWGIYLNNWGACDFGNSPAIDDNGVLYVGGHESGLFAVSPNGTVLWRYGWGVESSPVIGTDGIIYCSFTTGDPWKGIIHAFYPNGTIKWSFQANDVIQSSPAIGLDRNIVFGSHDTYVYSLYLNNGSLKWKYKTGEYWVHGSPSIGSDGTIYIGADDDYLYALNPNNGTLKWKLSTGAMRSSPSLDKEGTLYFATVNERFWAVYPNGTIKWTFSPKEYSGEWGSTAAISDDGVIYFGFEKRYFYPEGGWIFALDLNGTELWRKTITSYFLSSSPCIGLDGTVYIATEWDKRIGPGNSWASTGYLHAFGSIESNKKPNQPIISGDTFGFPGREIDHWFKAYDPDNNPLQYYIDWGDSTFINWTREYASGETVVEAHAWEDYGNYTIKIKARDVLGEESEWTTFNYTVGGEILNHALLFGKIYDYHYVDYMDEIHFKAQNLFIIIVRPFSINYYHLGEQIILVSRGITIIWESTFWFGIINGYFIDTENHHINEKFKFIEKQPKFNKLISSSDD